LHALRSRRSDLSTDLVLLLIEPPLLGGRDVTAVLAGFETLFLADKLVLRVQYACLERSNLAVAECLIDSPILEFKASIHLGPAADGSPTHPAEASWPVQATKPSDVMMTAKLGFLERVNIGLSPSVSGVLIHPTRETMPMARLSVVEWSIHETDMSMAQ
jgi:hypothetical protein